MTDSKWAMLCKLRVAAFDDPLWRWERKYDGCRMRVDISGREGVRLVARSGADKTAQFPDVVQALALTVGWDKVPLSLDCELVSAQGLKFQEFNQRRMNRTDDIALIAKELPAKLVAFDCLEAWGMSAKTQSLDRRLGLLDRVRPGCCWPPEATYGENGVVMFDAAEAFGWEGIVGKRLDEPYRPDKRAWVKVKVWQYGTFYVVGFTWGTGKRAGKVGALYLVDEDGNHVGNCGDFKGMTNAELDALTDRLKTNMMAENKGLVDIGTPFPARIKYQEVTNDGKLRFPVYLPPEDDTEHQNANPGPKGQGLV